MTPRLKFQFPNADYYTALNKAVDDYIEEYRKYKKETKYRAKIMQAEMDAEVLATEYFVSAGLGFVKYLN